MNKDIKKIAIVRLSALGDIVNSSIVLQFIKEFYPHAEISWIVENAFADILKNAKHLDHIHRVDLKRFKKEKKFSLLSEEYKKLKSIAEFDIIIDMQGLIKSAIVSRILGKNTHGFDKHSTRESLAALFYNTASNIAYETNVITRNAKVVSDALGINITDTMIENKEPVFKITKEFELRSDMKNIAFVIGASWESKRYPKEKVAEVCDELGEQCYIIWGNDKEFEDAEWICKHSEYATLAPKLTLDELISFISHMDLLMGNDTGPTHIAWAQNIPSITLLGPTTLRMIGQTPQNISIKSPSHVNILKIDKDDFSIKEIKPEQIISHAKEILCSV
ncbi:lipopolysaccharide heptosyltransferase I [Sulfurimonas paralvinellae]|uniref:Lipopolysaccharide heptosyltransferase 1 n=1 Tax=Sulfurimonas paralvinellae TaxID=317658 RepID=A0A7M1B9G8_9BACT|nr:lipopolysaccharide heptosyltransferase I [Sulfurimonas paralvinellae]QOP46281.1 lipopolysaccharide heptosyltransferase I [Sulfurimonas paralvinellae]